MTINGTQMPSAEVQLKALRWAMGYVENASDRPVILMQDDVTRSYMIRVGKDNEYFVWAHSFSELMQKLVQRWEAERDID